jgi:ABC-type uncharacterized transport system permease subunit/basic membrane lipoprotein Med (substrate-binding protein (PBP1-ABC) superfamily)
VSSANDGLKIGLVTDLGRIDDGTFNQYAYEGLMRAAEAFGLETDVVETEDRAGLERNIQQVIERGCRLLITIGSTMGAAIERLASRYTDVHFVIVDYQPLSESRNVTGLVFAEDQAGFMAGALAGLMTEAGVVGFVGGEDIEPVRKYLTGFQNGLAHTNRSARLVSSFTESFTDRNAGRTAAGELLGQGADVLFAAAGGSGGTALQTAAQSGAWVIGVDQDEWLTTFASGQVQGADRLLTSAVKQVDQAVYSAIEQALDGKLKPGLLTFDLADGGVGLAPYHATDAVISSEVKGKIREVADGLRLGDIRTGVGAAEGFTQRFLAWATAWNLRAALIPFLAIFTALVIGALFIAGFDPEVWEAFGQGIGQGLIAALRAIVTAYSAFFQGAFGNPGRIVRGIGDYIQTGDDTLLLKGIRPLTESIRISTPYIFAGLAVALGFRAGLFNIGAEGQYFIAGLTTVFVGYSITGFLPWVIHLPLAILAGIIGGALWAAIAGYLKARTGAHEVINTIMLNYIAFRLADFMLQVGGPMARPNDSRPVSPDIWPTAYLPQFFPADPAIRVNVGFFLALGTVAVVYWLLFKTTIGFELRAVGSNPRAARTAGINVERTLVLAMALSGGLAGMAGAHDILGVLHYMPNAFATGYGFDAIALALLGKSHPVGVLLASLLFGFLRAGAQGMQGYAHVPIDIISILQGLIIIFAAAPEVIRLIYHLRETRETAETVFTRGWGSV